MSDSAPGAPDGFAIPEELDYQLVGLIGRGTYGHVHLARGKDGDFYAVKVIYRASFENDRSYEREYRGILEFEPISRQSDSQLQVVHVGSHDHCGRYYYIMELADDEVTGRAIDPANYRPRTLKTEMQRRGALPAAECLEIGLHLARALENLHGHNLIHRDIKPANIIFVRGRAKLADVGLVTQQGLTLSCAGTPGYIPPEGPGYFTADIYALGKVLYEMWTGFSRVDFPRLPENLLELPNHGTLLGLNGIVTRACETKPARRYTSATAFRHDLERVAANRPLRKANGLSGLLVAILIGLLVAFATFFITRKLYPGGWRH